MRAGFDLSPPHRVIWIGNLGRQSKPFPFLRCLPGLEGHSILPFVKRRDAAREWAFAVPFQSSEDVSKGPPLLHGRIGAAGLIRHLIYPLHLKSWQEGVSNAA